jgi:hypothetical protein
MYNEHICRTHFLAYMPYMKETCMIQLTLCCTAYMSNICSATYKLHIRFLHICQEMCTAYKFITHISFLYDAYKKCFNFCIFRIYVSYTYMTDICSSTAYMLHIRSTSHICPIYATYMLCRIYAPYMVSRIYS